MKSILTSLFSLVLCATLHAQIPSYVPADGLVGWWPFNGNANDESWNGYDGNLFGASFNNDRFGQPNSAVYFNGATQPNTNNTAILRDEGLEIYNFNTAFSNKLTVSIWANVATTSNGDLLNKRTDNNIDFVCTLSNTNSTYLHMGNLGQAIGTSVLPYNEWHHYLYVYDNGIMSTYLDGVLDASNQTQGTISNNTNWLAIGKYIYHGGLTHYFFYNGSIDDIAIYNRALTPAEITQLYSAAEEPVATCTPLAPNLQNGLVGYWPFCGNANDESGNGNNGVVNGATLTSDRNGSANSAYSFDGIPDRVEIGSSLNPTNSIGSPNSSWSVSAWINRNNYTGVIAFSDYNSIAGNTNPGENDITLAVHLQVAEDKAYISMRSANIDFGTQGGFITPDQWHQIAFTASNGLITLFVDGAEVSSVSYDANLNFLEDPIYRIGTSMWNGNYGPSTGLVDDIALWNRALTPEEIAQLYTGAAAPCNLITSETQDTPVEVGGSAQMYVTLNSTDFSMQWQTNAAGLGWMDVQDNNTYTGSQTQNLLISNASLANHEQPFRIIVTDGICNDTSDVAMLLVNITCTAYDTITNVVEVFDTLTIENVVEVYDTLTIYNTIDIFDTTNVTVEVFDTITNVIDVLDTTTIYLQVDIFDTLFIDVYDTTYVQQTINVYDTTYVTLTDTTYIQVIDTAYVTVTDTLLIDITFIGFEGQPSWLNTVLVYPNPTSDHITIDYGNFALMAGYNTIITDAAGATVYSSAVNTQQATIDINAWGAAGVYYMSVYDVNGAVVAVRQIVLE